MTIEEMAKEYSFNTPLETIGHLHIDLDSKKALIHDVENAYKNGCKAVLEEIEKAWNSSSIGFIAEMAVIDKIKELKKG